MRQSRIPASLAGGELKQKAIVCFEFDGTNFQMVWASSSAGGPTTGGGPIYLLANANWYVNSSTGSDTLYDGTSPTVVAGTIHGPFATIQKACSTVPLYNLNNYNVTIHVADGSYGSFVAGKINGSGSVTIIGNTSTPGNCVITGTNITAAIFYYTQGQYTFRGFAMSTTGSSSSDPMCGIQIVGNSTQVFLGELTWGPCTGAHIAITLNAIAGNLIAGGLWTLAGGCSYWLYPGSLWGGCHLIVNTGGQFIGNANGGPAYNIPSAIGFSGSFVQCTSFGNSGLVYSSVTGFANVTVGRKFTVNSLSEIVTGGGGVNYYPGPTAGIADNTTGGYYQ
jgi:hypothetical protein